MKFLDLIDKSKLLSLLKFKKKQQFKTFDRKGNLVILTRAEYKARMQERLEDVNEQLDNAFDIATGDTISAFALRNLQLSKKILEHRIKRFDQ